MQRFHRAPHLRDLEERLAELAERIRPLPLPVARFGIEQDRLDDRFEIAAHARAVVVEHGRDALHVGRRRIARHQVLNQLLGDERPDVRVADDVIDGVAEILGRALVR